jgi:hypothetical protein
MEDSEGGNASSDYDTPDEDCDRLSPRPQLSQEIAPLLRTIIDLIGNVDVSTSRHPTHGHKRRGRKPTVRQDVDDEKEREDRTERKKNLVSGLDHEMNLTHVNEGKMSETLQGSVSCQE